MIAGFMDIEGAFNMTPTTVIQGAMKRFQVEEPIQRWITKMLTSRILVASRGNTELKGEVNRGCPQGGILSPLLWCMAVDDLITEIEICGATVVAYADDITFLATGKNYQIEPAKCTARTALNATARWCRRNGLSVNPAKMEMMLFTRRRNRPETIEDLEYMGKPLVFVRQVKYLGVTITDQLDWKVHVRNQISKARNNLHLMNRVVGNAWGLKPKVVLWIYQAIIVPRITYGAIAWWTTVTLDTIRRELDSLQCGALRKVLGAFRTTPGRAMEVLTGVPPLDIAIKRWPQHGSKTAVLGAMEGQTGRRTLLRDQVPSQRGHERGGRRDDKKTAGHATGPKRGQASF